jgi:hypothetical protein
MALQRIAKFEEWVEIRDWSPKPNPKSGFRARLNRTPIGWAGEVYFAEEGKEPPALEQAPQRPNQIEDSGHGEA